MHSTGDEQTKRSVDKDGAVELCGGGGDGERGHGGEQAQGVALGHKLHMC